VSDSDWARGQANAPVTLVEYGDFPCSHCRHAYPVVEAVLADAGEKVRFVYRPFPMTTSHDRAMPSALAADAAGRQGKFWEMYTRLFEGDIALTDAQLRSDAQAIGLDMDRFDRDRLDPEAEKRIKAVRWDGLRSGVSGTPTFFINGERHLGRPDQLAQAIADALKQGAS
jgi:protein-disulfide isomerase